MNIDMSPYDNGRHEIKQIENEQTSEWNEDTEREREKEKTEMDTLLNMKFHVFVHQK